MLNLLPQPSLSFGVNGRSLLDFVIDLVLDCARLGSIWAFPAFVDFADLPVAVAAVVSFLKLHGTACPGALPAAIR